MKWEFIPGVDNPADPINRLRLCVIHTNHDDNTSYTFQEKALGKTDTVKRLPRQCIISCTRLLPLGSTRGNKPDHMSIHNTRFPKQFISGITETKMGYQEIDPIDVEEIKQAYKEDPFYVDSMYTDLL